ncbi:hypothetical protein F7725_012439 [Dissostichus mawsoni]|uniref:Uncharacterized protein n=1 Tax=Dissostichus mawsoni TaxID=36200 RepID=A0A7J5YQJ7_DISMA|nr:hypothetical protein F7725_012439 [Dissostichus mawsoni]
MAVWAGSGAGNMAVRFGSEAGTMAAGAGTGAGTMAAGASTEAGTMAVWAGSGAGTMAAGHGTGTRNHGCVGWYWSTGPWLLGTEPEHGTMAIHKLHHSSEALALHLHLCHRVMICPQHHLRHYLPIPHLPTPHPESSVRKLMAETYPIQRETINDGTNVKVLKEEWPFLFEAAHLFDHASRLLGFSVQNKLAQELSKKEPGINNFLDTKGMKMGEGPVQLICGIMEPRFRKWADNSLNLAVTLEAKQVNQSNKARPWIRPLSPEEVMDKARTAITQHRGDPSNRRHLLGFFEIQFSLFREQTFR